MNFKIKQRQKWDLQMFNYYNDTGRKGKTFISFVTFTTFLFSSTFLSTSRNLEFSSPPFVLCSEVVQNKLWFCQVFLWVPNISSALTLFKLSTPLSSHFCSVVGLYIVHCVVHTFKRWALLVHASQFFTKCMYKNFSLMIVRATSDQLLLSNDI